MKKCYVVTFDLKNPGLNQENLITVIKSFGSWARLNSCSYLISSHSSAVQIRDHMLKYMYQTDKIYVAHLYKESAWFGMGDEISTWIRNNQV